MNGSKLPTISLEEAKKHLHGLVSDAQDSQHPTVIVTAGHPVAVLLSADSYQRLTRELELLRRLALGELESTIGHGFSLDQVSDECALLLEEN